MLRLDRQRQNVRCITFLDNLGHTLTTRLQESWRSGWNGSRLIAFANRADTHHEWALGIAARVTDPLLTCEAVLAEAAFQLQDASLVLAMTTDGFVALAFDCNDHLAQPASLAKRYADRRPGLADLCVIRMSELYPRHGVITVDVEDFRVCRRNTRETIPLISPPARRP